MDKHKQQTQRYRILDGLKTLNTPTTPAELAGVLHEPENSTGACLSVAYNVGCLKRTEEKPYAYEYVRKALTPEAVYDKMAEYERERRRHYNAAKKREQKSGANGKGKGQASGVDVWITITFGGATHQLTLAEAQSVFDGLAQLPFLRRPDVAPYKDPAS